jgi:hypothetical protein
MQDKSSFKSASFLHKHKVALSITSAVVLLIVLAYGMPVLVGDGVGRFSGAKLRMAQETLQETYDMEDDMSRSLHMFDRFQYYVEGIQEMPIQEARQYCKLSDGDDGTGYYYVDISRVTLFGIRIFKHQENLLSSCSNSRYIKNTP